MKKRFGFWWQIAVSVAVLAGFFALYNYFLLDSSIERLHLALQDVSQADTDLEVEGASLFLQDFLVSEVGKPDVNLERLVASDAIQRALLPSEALPRKAGAKFLLSELLSSYEGGRHTFFQWADSWLVFLKDRLYELGQFGRYLIGKAGIQQVAFEKTEETQVDILRKAREFELRWQFEDAIQAYQFFIDSFPDYPKLALVKLYLASVYLRSGHYRLAGDVLGGLDLTLASASEIRLVSALKRKLGELEALAKKRSALELAIRRFRESTQVTSVAEPSHLSSHVAARLRSGEMTVSYKNLAEKVFEVGLSSLYLYDLASAKKAFREVLNLKPSEDLEKQTMWLEGWIELLQNNYEESRRLMRELLERFPEDPFAALGHYALAAIAERSGDYNQAAEEYEKLAKITQDEKASFLLNYRAGDVSLYDLEDLPRAQRLFSEAKRLAPSARLSGLFESEVIPSIEADIRDSAFRRLFLGDTKTARQFFEDALRVNPDDAWANSGYGLTLYMDGETKEGIKYVNRGRNLRQDEYTASALGFVTEMEGDPDSASQFYEEAIRHNPGYLVALYNLGRLEVARGDLKQGLDHFTEARKRSGRFPQCLALISNNLGVAAFKLEKTEDAENRFREAIQFNPLLADAYFNLSQLYRAQGKTDAAEQYERLVEKAGAQVKGASA